MKTETVVWDADQREIPGHGIATKGDQITLPKHMATSYIYQGLAIKKTKSTNKVASTQLSTKGEDK